MYGCISCVIITGFHVCSGISLRDHFKEAAQLPRVDLIFVTFFLSVILHKFCFICATTDFPHFRYSTHFKFNLLLKIISSCLSFALPPECFSMAL